MMSSMDSLGSPHNRHRSFTAQLLVISDAAYLVSYDDNKYFCFKKGSPLQSYRLDPSVFMLGLSCTLRFCACNYFLLHSREFCWDVRVIRISAIQRDVIFIFFAEGVVRWIVPLSIEKCSVYICQVSARPFDEPERVGEEWNRVGVNIVLILLAELRLVSNMALRRLTKAAVKISLTSV